MSPTPPRPGRPSRRARTPTSRPRRVAGSGRADAVDAAGTSVDVPPAEVRDDEHVGHPERAERVEPTGRRAPAVDLGKTTGSTTAAPVAPDPAADDDAPRRRGDPVRLLAAVVALLLAVGVGEAVYLVATDDGDGDAAASSEVSAERPVQVAELTVRSVVDQAVTAADLILSASTSDYDAQVEQAAAAMTDPFAEQFRATKADVKAKFVAEQTEVVIDVSYQGVVTATADEIVALLFLTQTTQKGTRGGVVPVQYRVTVTMVDTPDGWLVSDLQAL